MEAELLTLSLMREIQSLCEVVHAPLSEYNFPNLFLFREKHAYQYLREEGLIRGISYDQRPFFIPLQLPLEPVRLKALLEKEGGMLFPIPDEWINVFPVDHFDKEELREDEDYLFKRETLAELPGRARASRRNLIYQFEREYPLFEVLPLEEEHLPRIHKLLDEWEKLGQEGDVKSAREALSLMESLDLEGIWIKDGGQAAAYALFSRLNEETLVLHFAKSLPRFKGGHTFLMERVAKGTSYPWINIEQDLGLPGLRREKESFHPDALKKKWRVFLKGSKK